ncbi:MAG: histidine phosphatase family protein [Candidatus Micrarchaeota archaeon]|nr:histidine phosphatase family protein [Candidatus Micrarchaeota archaeon]
MKVLILVRHGQAESNAGIILSSSLNRYPLTQHGVEQANGTAKELKKVQKIDMIMTSSPH